MEARWLTRCRGLATPRERGPCRLMTSDRPAGSASGGRRRGRRLAATIVIRPVWGSNQPSGRCRASISQNGKAIHLLHEIMPESGHDLSCSGAYKGDFRAPRLTYGDNVCRPHMSTNNESRSNGPALDVDMATPPPLLGRRRFGCLPLSGASITPVLVQLFPTDVPVRH